MDEIVGGTQPGEAREAALDERAASRGRFDGITNGDYVRDLLGVLALVLALQLPWSAAGGTAAVPWALASLLLLLVPLALPYLARLGALPAAWTVHSTRRARVLLALPVVGAVVAQLVLDALRVSGAQGVGSAVGIALAAAALAAVPRSSELGPRDLDARVTRSWRAATTVLGALTALAPVAWVVVIAVERLRVPDSVRDADGLTGLIIGFALVTALVVGALLAPAVLAALTRTAVWRRAAVVVASTWAVALFVTGGHFSIERLESVRTLVIFGEGSRTFVAGATVLGYGLFLVGAVAVLVTSPAVVRAAKDEGDPAIGWFVTARGLLSFLAVLAGLLVIVTLIVAVEDRVIPDSSVILGNRAPGLASLLPGAVVALIIGGLALKVRSMLVGRPADARRPALAATVGLAALGVVLVVVTRLDEASAFLPSQHVALLALVTGVGLPVAVAASLTLPSSVREHVAAYPATPREQDPASAYVWRPRVGPISHGQGAPSAPAPSAPTAAPAVAAGPAAPVMTAGHAAPAAAPADRPAQVEVSGHVARVDQVAPAAADQVAPAAAAEAVAPERSASAGEPDGQLASDGGVPAGEQITEVLRLDEPEAPGTVLSETPEATPAGADRTRRSEAGFTWAEACDPQTPATTLAQIAQDAPTLRPALALNPSTYPALLDWLAQLGDAEVDEALRSRSS